MKMQEKVLNKSKNGMAMLLVFTLLYAAAVAAAVIGGINANIPLIVISVVYISLGWIFFLGLKVLRPQEALVLTLFGNYIGTLREPGFYYVNPFCVGVNPAAKTRLNQSSDVDGGQSPALQLLSAGVNPVSSAEQPSKKISLKIMTLNNARQKINDRLGNPIEIGIAVMWRVTDTAKAVFNVDNYKEYLSLQCDSALRNIVRIYPYDVAENVDTTGDGVADEGSLLQRQQASAIVDARKLIVDGAVGMVELALERLSEKQVVELDEERKAAMVSNLLVVLCGNRDAQPVVNSGSIY